jgi:hypothetical protein
MLKFVILSGFDGALSQAAGAPLSGRRLSFAFCRDFWGLRSSETYFSKTAEAI